MSTDFPPSNNNILTFILSHELLNEPEILLEYRVNGAPNTSESVFNSALFGTIRICGALNLLAPPA